MSLQQKFIQTQDLPPNLQDIAKSQNPFALTYAAQSSDRTQEELALLARHYNPWTRYGVIGNTAASPELLRELADDIAVLSHNGERVFEHVPTNANAPADALDKVYAKRSLLGEFGYQTIMRLFNHPNASRALRDAIAQDPMMTRLRTHQGNTGPQ